MIRLLHPAISGYRIDARPIVSRRLLVRGMAVLLSAILAIAWLGGFAAQAHAASGNASAAAGFLEKAQNKDGGFGAKQGKPSNPTASLWAAVALLAAGKNPGDEWVKGGSSLDEYLAAHSSDYTSLADLGLLTMVQSAAEDSSSYGDPAAKLEAALTPSAASAEPEGGALGVLGLWAAGTSSARQIATAAAQALLASPTSDGGWGREALSTSAATALVLQALAVSGVASSSTPAVHTGVEYLHKAQGNDGSIALSIRADQAIASGSVTATALTIQALDALHLPPLATPTGKTVLQGLTQYQQKTTGGLSSDGSLYGDIPPSVVETAQAFPAFDGITFPLASVARTTEGPPKKSSSTKKPKSTHVSSGTASQGVAGESPTGADQGAFKQSTAAPPPKQSKPAGKHAKHQAKKSGTASEAGGTSVSGTVVGATKKPKLATVAGQSGGGLSATAKATLTLVAILLACALLGGILDSRRPRRDGRSATAVGVAAGAGFLAWARARGSLAPFAVLLVGVALILIPLQSQMFTRAPKGASMVQAFKPYMQPARLATYKRDVRQLDQAVSEASSKGAALLSPGTSARVAKKHFAAAAPEAAKFAGQWPAINKTFTGLLGTIDANRGNYDAVAALPSFTAFPWFFVIPGGILVLLSAAALLWARAWRRLRWAVVVLGVGLLLAPVAFGMWSRAPSGASMIAAFKTVETRGLVTKLQNDFGSIAIGEGVLGGELVPALEKQGLSARQIDAQLPALPTLERNWVGILQNLTPLLGVMSDQVASYQAVAALPAFGLFPWLFTIAGLLVLVLVGLGAGALGRLPLRRQRTGERAAASHARRVPEPHGEPALSEADSEQRAESPRQARTEPEPRPERQPA